MWHKTNCLDAPREDRTSRPQMLFKLLESWNSGESHIISTGGSDLTHALKIPAFGFLLQHSRLARPTKHSIATGGQSWGVGAAGRRIKAFEHLLFLLLLNNAQLASPPHSTLNMPTLATFELSRGGNPTEFLLQICVFVEHYQHSFSSHIHFVRWVNARECFTFHNMQVVCISTYLLVLALHVSYSTHGSSWKMWAQVSLRPAVECMCEHAIESNTTVVEVSLRLGHPHILLCCSFWAQILHALSCWNVHMFVNAYATNM